MTSTLYINAFSLHLYHQRLLSNAARVAQAPGISLIDISSCTTKLHPSLSSPLTLSPTSHSHSTLTLAPSHPYNQHNVGKYPPSPSASLTPRLVDDFYPNLLAWSSQDVLAVTLSKSTHIWRASSGAVSKVG